MNVRKLREKLFHLDDQNQSAIEAVLILIPELSAERDELLEALLCALAGNYWHGSDCESQITGGECDCWVSRGRALIERLK